MTRAPMPPAFLAAYLEALAFTERGPDSDIPPDAELSPDALEQCRADCQLFWDVAGDVIRDAGPNLGRWPAPEMAGHDMWLTRNGHGAGFWDGDWPDDTGQLLTDLARLMGEVDVCEGDDGRVHL